MSKNTAKQVKTRHEMTKAEWTWFLVKQNKTAYFMIAPFMILFFIFTQFSYLNCRCCLNVISYHFI